VRTACHVTLVGRRHGEARVGGFGSRVDRSAVSRAARVGGAVGGFASAISGDAAIAVAVAAALARAVPRGLVAGGVGDRGVAGGELVVSEAGDDATGRQEGRGEPQ